MNIICIIYYVVFGTGDLSSADWSVRRLGGGGSLLSSTDDPATAAPAYAPGIQSSGVTRRSRQCKVLENRDLCRIVASFIPRIL